MSAGFAKEPDIEEAVPDLEGAEAFLDYMDSPRSIGLDGLKPELRHMILMMMELQGYETGYRSQQMLGLGHTSMILSGVVASDWKKRKLDEEFWEQFYRMLAQLETRYELVVTHVQKRIDTVQAEILSEVQAIDAQIEAQAAGDAHAETIKAGHERRSVLKWLLRRMDRHEEELQNADTAAEAVQLHQKVEQDIADVQQGNVSANRSASRPSPLTKISEFVHGRRKKTQPDHEPQHSPDRHTDSEDSQDGSGKGGKGGKTGSGSASGGSAAGDNDDLPPPPVAPDGF